MDCRNCSTLFDFSKVAEDVSFAELIEFPRVVFSREYSIFLNYSDFRRSPKMIVLFVELVGFRNTDFLNDVRFDAAFPKIF